MKNSPTLCHQLPHQWLQVVMNLTNPHEVGNNFILTLHPNISELMPQNHIYACILALVLDHLRIMQIICCLFLRNMRNQVILHKIQQLSSLVLWDANYCALVGSQIIVGTQIWGPVLGTTPCTKNKERYLV